MVEIPKFCCDEELIPPSSETETVSEFHNAEDNGVSIQAKVNASVQRDEHESKKLQSQFETDNVIENLGSEMGSHISSKEDPPNHDITIDSVSIQELVQEEKCVSQTILIMPMTACKLEGLSRIFLQSLTNNADYHVAYTAQLFNSSHLNNIH